VTRVSYQGMLDRTPRHGGVYARLGAQAIATRRKDARARITATVSEAQRRWLDEVAELTGERVDADAVLRALIDLGMELDVDWPLIARGKMLRDAVRASVMVHRAPDGEAG
jgi:hypothetical protein